MKFLKWLFIVIVAVIGIVLVVAIFLPAHVSIKAQTQIEKPALFIFHNLATFNEREEWDPWVSTDTTADVEIKAEERYVGSSYEWNGEKVKTGKVVVDSIVFGEFISSSINFGKEGDDADVSWRLEETEDGTTVTWGFDMEAAYPVGRLFMAIGKGMLQTSYEQGLSNLKEHLESKETRLSSLSEVKQTTRPEMLAMVAESSGSMEELVQRMGNLYGAVYGAISEQGLEIAGPAFAYYFNYDEANNTSSVQCGFPVKTSGKSSGAVVARSFPEYKVLKAIHTGPYEEFEYSYNKMMEFVQKNETPVTWEAFEDYLTDMEKEPFSTLWKTSISFVIAE